MGNAEGTAGNSESITRGSQEPLILSEVKTNLDNLAPAGADVQSAQENWFMLNLMNSKV